MKIDDTSSVPLYRQIVNGLKEKISSGQLKEGDRLDPHQVLAEQFNVSLTTVKKAIAELVNEDLIYVRPAKGTFIAPGKKQPKSIKHKTIGLVLSDLMDPFFSMIATSVEEKAVINGYSLFLSNTSEKTKKEEQLIHQFYHMHVDGLIIASMMHDHRGPVPIRMLKEKVFPFVMVSYIEDEDIPYVGTDHELGAYLGTNHLVKLGYKRIGYINAEKNNPLGQLRGSGYRRALQEAGMEIHEDRIFELKQEDYPSGYAIGCHFAKLKDKPDAVFVFNDVAALGFEQAVLDAGLKVPTDVAIVGFDDIDRDLYAPVPLTTVHQPTKEIGAAAFEVLLNLIMGRKVLLRTILKPKLVVRKSCGSII